MTKVILPMFCMFLGSIVRRSFNNFCPRNIYANTKEECVIAEMKAEVAAESKRLESEAKASCRDKNLVSVCAGR